MNVLITGGAGNIGSALAKKLIQEEDYYVVIVDNLLTGSIDNLPTDQSGRWSFEECDVNDRAQITEIFQAYKFQFVFHYAAVVGVERTLNHPLWVLNDIEGTKNLLELSRKNEVRRFFYSSSSEVYGEPVETPQHEDTTPLNSRLPYAIVKNVCEAFIRTYSSVYNVKYTIFRFFNTYGPHQSTDFVIPRFVEAALNNRPIQIYGDGLQTRTFCYIDDNIETVCLILQNGLVMNETVNVGSDDEISILDLAHRIKKYLNSNSEIVHFQALEEGDMTRRQPDISKMINVLGHGLTPLEHGVGKVAESRIKNIRS